MQYRPIWVRYASGGRRLGHRSCAVNVDNARQDPFSTEQRQYLAALLDNDAEKAQAVLDAAGTSEDILVDVINEAAFDIVGDTIIEFTSQGPAIIPDYEQDVRGLIDYD